MRRLILAFLCLLSVPYATRSQVISATEIESSLTVRGFGIQPSIILRVDFDFDSDQLTSQAKVQLDELGRALNSDRLISRRFELAGHTDGVGSAEYNKVLSQRRAEAVARYLREHHGVEAGRLEAVGRGEDELLNRVNPSAAENRRVEVRNVGRYEPEP